VPVEVVGAGWGRTGTLSLKLALDMLGFPCHHMREVFVHPDHVEVFTAAARGEAVDWEQVYAPYRATVDWPGAAFWRELIAAYPEAKVVLSRRDPQRWYESYQETIYKALGERLGGDMADWSEMVQAVIVERDFGGNPHDRDHLVAAFERHNAEVIASVPADRLLVYEAAHGWGPLCAFLGIAVPDEPFPHVNDRATWNRDH
jgi:hypothetical protein